MINGKDYTISSDNIFADASLPNPEECLARVQLLKYAIAEIKKRGLTQKQAAALLGIPQPHVSYLLQARLSCFSLERLIQMVTKLGVVLTISGELVADNEGHVVIKLPQPV